MCVQEFTECTKYVRTYMYALVAPAVIASSHAHIDSSAKNLVEENSSSDHESCKCMHYFVFIFYIQAILLYYTYKYA